MIVPGLSVSLKRRRYRLDQHFSNSFQQAQRKTMMANIGRNAVVVVVPGVPRQGAQMARECGGGRTFLVRAKQHLSPSTIYAYLYFHLHSISLFLQ